MHTSPGCGTHENIGWGAGGGGGEMCAERCPKSGQSKISECIPLHFGIYPVVTRGMHWFVYMDHVYAFMKEKHNILGKNWIWPMQKHDARGPGYP